MTCLAYLAGGSLIAFAIGFGLLCLAFRWISKEMSGKELP